MAWVQRLLPIELQAVDDDTATSPHGLWLPSLTDYDDAVTFLLAYAPLVSAVSDCAIQRITLGIPLEDEAPAPPAGDTWNAGVFIFRDSGGNLWDCALPGFDPSKLRVDGVTIDQSDPDVTAFVDGVISGVGGVAPVSPEPWALPLASLEAAYLEIRPIYSYVRKG